jgi:hypothetical protein
MVPELERLDGSFMSSFDDGNEQAFYNFKLGED